MQRWQFMTLTVRIAADQGKMPGFFARGQSTRSVHEDSLKDLNTLGRDGWELVNILLLELGTLESGPGYACAVLKRPIADTAQ